MARRGPRCDKHAKRGSRASRPQDLTVDLNGRSNPEVVGSIPTEVKRILSLPRVVP